MEMTLPVTINRDVEVNAITLSFSYRNDLIEVLGTNYADDDMFIRDRFTAVLTFKGQRTNLVRTIVGVNGG